MKRVRLGIVGCGKRSREVYCPLIRTLSNEVELVAVQSRSLTSAEAMGKLYKVPYYTDVGEMLEKEEIEAVIVSVSSNMNGSIGAQVAEMGVNMILETPIALDLREADEIIRRAEKNRIKVEIAEENFRLPMERLKLELIRRGCFGKVNVAHNDFTGHGYFGISIVRSYIGWDEEIVKVWGFRKPFKVHPHYSTLKGMNRDEEIWQHGVLEFESGAVGVFNFTSVYYDAPMRWHRSTVFLGERGMGAGDEMAIVSHDGSRRIPIKIDRERVKVGDVDVTSRLVAHTDPPVVWDNPLKTYPLNDETLSVASVIMAMVRCVREGAEPEYRMIDGRRDQEANLAMMESATRGGLPVELPLIS